MDVLCWHIRKTEYSDLHFRSENIRTTDRIYQLGEGINSDQSRANFYDFWGIIFIKTNTIYSFCILHNSNVDRFAYRFSNSGIFMVLGSICGTVAALFFRCRQACCRVPYQSPRGVGVCETIECVRICRIFGDRKVFRIYSDIRNPVCPNMPTQHRSESSPLHSLHAAPYRVIQ